MSTCDIVKMSRNQLQRVLINHKMFSSDEVKLAAKIEVNNRRATELYYKQINAIKRVIWSSEYKHRADMTRFAINSTLRTNTR